MPVSELACGCFAHIGSGECAAILRDFKVHPVASCDIDFSGGHYSTLGDPAYHRRVRNALGSNGKSILLQS